MANKTIRVRQEGVFRTDAIRKDVIQKAAIRKAMRQKDF